MILTQIVTITWQHYFEETVAQSLCLQSTASSSPPQLLVLEAYQLKNKVAQVLICSPLPLRQRVSWVLTQLFFEVHYLFAQLFHFSYLKGQSVLVLQQIELLVRQLKQVVLVEITLKFEPV